MQDLNKAGEVRRASAPIQILQGGNIYWEKRQGGKKAMVFQWAFRGRST